MVEHPKYCTFKGREVYVRDCRECELAEVCQGIPERLMKRGLLEGAEHDGESREA